MGPDTPANNCRVVIVKPAMTEVLGLVISRFLSFNEYLTSIGSEPSIIKTTARSGTKVIKMKAKKAKTVPIR